MAVRATKTEPKCKLCRHEKRDEIDAILELRSKLTRDPVTKELIWTAPKVLAQLAEWGVENPTEENIKTHWKRHCEVVSEESAAADDAAALEAFKKLLTGEAGHADADEMLRLVVSIWGAKVAEQIARGEVPNITTEQMLKAQAELTRRSTSETQHQLLTMFAQGMTQAAQLKGGEQVQLEAGDDVIEQAEDADFEPVEEAA